MYLVQTKVQITYFPVFNNRPWVNSYWVYKCEWVHTQYKTRSNICKLIPLFPFSFQCWDALLVHSYSFTCREHWASETFSEIVQSCFSGTNPTLSKAGKSWMETPPPFWGRGWLVAELVAFIISWVIQAILICLLEQPASILHGQHRSAQQHCATGM